MKLGLLLEGAHAQQLAAKSLTDELRAQIAGLDAVTREEIRHTLVEELGSVVAEANRAAESLRHIGRTSLMRHALWTAAVTVSCAYVPLLALRWSLPSSAELAALQARRDVLKADVAALMRQGGQIDLRHCGEPARVCVRVDRRAPAYGADADYYVAAGR